ncbi:hypothetical protein MRX96_046661 [Rhipicephalus microplus]
MPTAPAGPPVIHFPEGTRAAPAGSAASVRHQSSTLLSPVSRRTRHMPRALSIREDLEELWVISELQGIPVIAKEAADRWTSTSFLHGVGGDPDVETPMPGSLSIVAVLLPPGRATQSPCGSEALLPQNT